MSIKKSFIKLIDKCIEKTDKIVNDRVEKVENKKKELIERIAKTVAKNIYDNSDKLDYFRNESDGEDIYKVSRFTVKIPWMTKKEFRLLTDDSIAEGGQWNREVGGFDAIDLEYAINKEFTNMDFEGSLVIGRFSERRVGCFRDFDGYNIYIEFYRKFDILDSIYKRIMKTFEKHKFILEKLNNEECVGMRMEIPIKLERKDYELIDEYSLDDTFKRARVNIHNNHLAEINGEYRVWFGVGVEGNDYGDVKIVIKVNSKNE